MTYLRFKCKVCGEMLKPNASLREHLSRHHPGAWKLGYTEVRNQFKVMEIPEQELVDVES